MNVTAIKMKAPVILVIVRFFKKFMNDTKIDILQKRTVLKTARSLYIDMYFVCLATIIQKI